MNIYLYTLNLFGFSMVVFITLMPSNLKEIIRIKYENILSTNLFQKQNVIKIGAIRKSMNAYKLPLHNSLFSISLHHHGIIIFNLLIPQNSKVTKYKADLSNTYHMMR